MRATATLFLITLLLISNGCMSIRVIQNAKGCTGEPVEPAKLRKGDRVFVRDGLGYVIQYPAQQDNTNLPVPAIPPGYAGYYFYVCKPRPVYYALLPLSVPADVATFPFQAVYIAYLLLSGNVPPRGC